MEYINEITVKLLIDTNKGMTEKLITLGEFDENETLKEFRKRVSIHLKEIEKK